MKKITRNLWQFKETIFCYLKIFYSLGGLTSKHRCVYFIAAFSCPTSASLF